jgi:hypothetical protein
MLVAKKIKELILLMLLCIMLTVIFNTAKAQENQPYILQTLQSIYKNYDSVKYLSFDVVFEYGSDTLLGNFDKEQMDGTYTMAGNRLKYRLGDVDFMQNDSFFIAIYNKDKLIMVDEPKTINAGSQLPMRQQLDSLINNYSEHYTITQFLNDTKDTGVIQLTRLDSTALFDLFSITYDNDNKMLYKLIYEYKEIADLNPDVKESYKTSEGLSADPIQKKRFAIHFLNYRYDNYDDEIYDENNYIWFENGYCKPVSKYEDYKIYYAKPTVNFYEQQEN